MKFKDIPQLTRDANYQVNVGWDYVEGWIKDHQERNGSASLDLDPDFQRAHIWTDDQQRAYVEYSLKGGKASNVLRFNCAGWMVDFRGPFVIVDGKQRLEAVRKFLRNELRAFGNLYNEFEDRLRIMQVDFVMMINSLDTRKKVLQWYLDINTGGTVHTNAEIDKVRKLLEKE